MHTTNITERLEQFPKRRPVRHAGSLLAFKKWFMMETLCELAESESR